MPPPDVKIGLRYACCDFWRDTSIAEYFWHSRKFSFRKRASCNSISDINCRDCGTAWRHALTVSSEVKAAEVHLSNDIGTLRYFMPIRKFALNFEIFTDVSYYRIISCHKIKRYKLRKKFVKEDTTQDNYWPALTNFYLQAMYYCIRSTSGIYMKVYSLLSVIIIYEKAGNIIKMCMSRWFIVPI